MSINGHALELCQVLPERSAPPVMRFMVSVGAATKPIQEISRGSFQSGLAL